MTHTPSIISNEYCCIRCGRTSNLERHHCIYGNGRRLLSEKFGLWVYLCPDHHTLGRYAVHRDRDFDLTLHQLAQGMWEDKYGTREEFIKEFGRSWL